MEAQSLALSCDDSYISLLVNVVSDHEALMSDDKYAEELQLQETIMVSLISVLQKQPPNSTISENTTTSIEIQHESSSNQSQKSVKKIGESSQTLCEICAERKDHDQIFLESCCTHGFCTECINKHISITINKKKNNYENPPTMITCPTGCVLEIDACREIVGKEVVTMWDELITESMIPSSQRFYCPYKNCSALLVNDGDRTVVIREAECPFCRRLFCVRCYVPWHAGVSCDEFSKMSENEREREDLMVLHELAKKNKWQRCPSCKFFVEKNEGCLHMTCRCGFQFCYACGAAWSSTHGGCQRP